MKLSVILVLNILKLIRCIALDSDLGFILVTPTGCICPGQTLIFECNVIGGASTVLTSTACAGNQEITLLHSRYENPGGTTSKIVCDDGAIELVGQSLGIENNNSFSSQLQIKLNDYFIESLVSCQHDDGMTAKLIGNYSISTIDPLPPPSDISWERLGLEEVMFSWSPVVSNCSSIHYNILDSNCGICPNSTTDTNITCTNVSTSHLSMCMLAVQTVMCGNISGEWSIQVQLLELQNDMYSLSIGAIIAITVSSVVLLLGIVLVLFGLMKKRKSSKTTLVSIGPPVVNNPRSGSKEAEANHQPIAAFHCDPTNDTRGYTLCQSDYDQITVPNSNYSHLDYTQCKDLQMQSNTALFGGLHPLDTQSMSTGCVRVEDESLDLESLLAKLQGRVSTQWFQFGLAIGVPKEILEHLRGYPIEQCLVELLDYWLRYHPDRPTWKELADAIEDIQDYELASSILKVYEKT